MLFKSKKELIGIDIGSSAVKLIRLRKVKDAYYLVNLGIAPLEPEVIVDNAIMDSAYVADAIRNLVSSNKIKVKDAASSISGNSIIIRKLQLPLMTPEELESSIQWEAEQYIPFELTEVDLDFQILGLDTKDPSQMNVILAAAKKEIVNDTVSVLQDAGLVPAVMDVDCFALENAFVGGYGQEEGETTALVHIGASSIVINIVKDGVTVFNRDVQVGGNMYNDEIQRRLGIDSADAERAKLGDEIDAVDQDAIDQIKVDVTENLALEIRRSIDFFSATTAEDVVGKTYISGGVAKASELKIVLERTLEMPVEVLDPFRHVVINEKEFDFDYVQAVAPLFTVAVGLAMREVGDK